MLKTTRNKDGKQTKPSKILVPIIRNRMNVYSSTYWADSRIQPTSAPMDRNRHKYFKVAICDATTFKRVSDALTGLFHRSNPSITKATYKFYPRRLILKNAAVCQDCAKRLKSRLMIKNQSAFDKHLLYNSERTQKQKR